MLPQQASGLAIDGKDKPVFGGREYDTILFGQHNGGMLVAEAHVAGPQLARLVGQSGVTYHAIAHGLGVNTPLIGRYSERLAHHALLCGIMLATALGVDGGQHTARIGHEYLATAHDRPHAGRRIVHVLPPRGPLPQLFAVLTAQGVERICPIAEHYHAVFDEWFGLDVAANTAPLPHDSAVANADGSKMMVATAYVGYAAVDGYGAHHGPLGGYFPA